MFDHFAILGQPRRPWLDAELLKEEFHRRSAALHPDVPGTGDAAQFTGLNTAHAVLREPVTRLRHLLELVAPALPAEPVTPPAELGDLFMKLAGLRRQLDRLREKRAVATNALSRALLAGTEAELRHAFTALHTQLDSASDAVLDEVRALDSAWSGEDPAAIEALARHYHRLAYLTRWLTQSREALFALEKS